jgi:hypothetical protein
LRVRDLFRPPFSFPKSHEIDALRGIDRHSYFVQALTFGSLACANSHLNVRDQIRLLHDLPAHLKIQPDDVGWLKATERTEDRIRRGKVRRVGKSES